MGNYNVTRTERLFIREALLKKYCSLVGHTYKSFGDGLTGTLGHYERISDVIADYMEDESLFAKYIDLIADSPLKIRLRKIAQGRDEDRKRFLREWKSFTSPNVLRKLIFYGTEEGVMSFKEDFITACYYYIQVDRSEFLRNQGFQRSTGKKGDTISPILTDRASIPARGQTVPAFNRPASFSLKFLKDTDEIDEGKKALDFSGESIPLNRENLDPANFTITSKVQAEIKLVNGEWYIENRSRLKTTFIQVIDPVKLKKGDIIIMGNKRFLFDG